MRVPFLLPSFKPVKVHLVLCHLDGKGSNEVFGQHHDHLLHVLQQRELRP